MAYADADFFLALFKPEDWLKGNAKDAYARNRGSLWTSGSTALELLLVSKAFNLDPIDVMVALFATAEVKDMEKDVAIAAAHYIRDHNLTTFDAFHAAYCGKDKMLSSDAAFDKLGFDRIKLEKS